MYTSVARLALVIVTLSGIGTASGAPAYPSPEPAVARAAPSPIVPLADTVEIQTAPPRVFTVVDAPPPRRCNSGLAYLYGHRVEPPFEFGTPDSVLTINGIQVFPALAGEGRCRAPCWLARSETELEAQALSLDARLRALGIGASEKAHSVMAFVVADTALVKWATLENESQLSIYWRSGYGDWIPLGDADHTSGEERSLQLTLWDRYLSRNAVVVFGRGWVCMAESESDKRALLAEIDRAAHDAGATWTGKYIADPEDAQMFRAPLLQERQPVKGR